MKIYQASLNLKILLKYHELFPNKKLDVLRSFGMLDTEMSDFLKKHRNKIGSLICDSGTWTKNNAKPDIASKITLSSYKSFIKRFGHYFDFYFNFDSDFSDNGFEPNYCNLKVLEDAGLRAVPVVHDIYGVEIDTYIEGGYSRIALGSPQIKSIDHLVHVMRKFEGTGIKIHLFGNTRFDFISNFPIHSCDSAGWARTGGYGYINYWNPKKEGRNKTDRIYMEECLNPNAKRKKNFSNYEYRDDLENYLHKTLGITEGDLLGLSGAVYKQLVNTHYYVQLAEIVNQIHRDKGFHTTTDNDT